MPDAAERLAKYEELTAHRDVEGRHYIPPRGSIDAKLMIVTSHPTVDDLKEGQILSGASGEEVSEALKRVGLKEEDCWITSIVKFGTGSKGKPDAAMIQASFADLDAEIEFVKPKLIIALGAEPLKRIMKTNVKHTSYCGEIYTSPYGPILTNHSPVVICNFDPTKRNEFVEIFYLAWRFMNDRLKYDDYEYVVINDPAENTALLKRFMDEGKWSIGYDMEWQGKFCAKEVIHTFQYSVEHGKAVILNISDDGLTENTELLNTMKLFLEHPKADRLGWNIRSDDKRLTVRGFKLADETLGFDGMKAVAFFDSRLPKGLETGIKRYTNYKPYYVAFNMVKMANKIADRDLASVKFIDPDVFYSYCGGDAVSHYTACLTMRAEMEKLPERVRRYYKETYLPLSNYFLDLECEGIAIDIELMDKLTNQYTDCYKKLEARVLKLVADVGMPEFNPRSAIDKKKLLYDVLELDPPYYVNKSKTKPRAWWITKKKVVQDKYSPSTNTKSLSTLKFELTDAAKKNPEDLALAGALEIITTLLDMTRVNVFANKFLTKQGVEMEGFVPGVYDDDPDDEEDGGGASPLKSSYWNALTPDKKIHADFYECLANFRSSSRPNVQNPASKVLAHMEEIFKKQGMETPKNFRNIIYPGHPDWHFTEVDVAGADLAIAAFLSKDPKYIHDIRSGGFHVKKMREYFDDPKLGKEDVDKYVSAKAITFRVAYTSGLIYAALPIQAEIYAESGIYLDIETIKYALNTWYNYDQYMAYREKCTQQVEDSMYTENARGMRLYFEKTDDFVIKAGWCNEALAFVIASELALFMWEIATQLKRQFKKDGVWLKYCKPTNCVHDALYWSIHKDLMKDNYFPEVCKYYFTDKCKIATGDNLGMEMIVSDCWKGKKKVFSKETVWDFKTEEWKWK